LKFHDADEYEYPSHTYNLDRVSESGSCPSNSERLYTDKKNTKLGEVKKRKIGKLKRKRDCTATLSDFYPSTCLTGKALPGV